MGLSEKKDKPSSMNSDTLKVLVQILEIHYLADELTRRELVAFLMLL